MNKLPNKFEWIQPGRGCVYQGKTYIILTDPVFKDGAWFTELAGKMLKTNCANIRPAVVVILTRNFAKDLFSVLRHWNNWGRDGILKRGAELLGQAIEKVEKK